VVVEAGVFATAPLDPKLGNKRILIIGLRHYCRKVCAKREEKEEKEDDEDDED
jgi:hypothetical protein